MTIRSIQLALLLLAATAVAAQPRDAGYPLIESYAEKVANAGGGSQNYRVTVDPRGAVLASNLHGLLIHDGAAWSLRPVGSSEIVYGIATDSKGRIAVGGNMEFGIFEPDERGTLHYTSLKDKLPKNALAYDQVSDVFTLEDGFLFDSLSWLARWDGRELTILEQHPYPSDRVHGKAFDTGNGLYAWLTDRGVVRFDGTKFVNVPGGEVFRERRVDAILGDDRGVLVSVRGEGLFTLADGNVAPFAPEASKWTAEARIRNTCVLPDGRWAFGSLRSGLMLLRRDGTIDQIIDTASGLPDNHVQGLGVDREGGLWVALANGLVRVEVEQPLSLIDARNGLEGSVHEVVRHEGELWAVTTAGVFTTAGADRGLSPVAQFRQVTELPSVGWSLLSSEGELFVGTYEGVFVIEAGRPVRIEETERATSYAMLRSGRDHARIWLGMSEGLASIRLVGGRWSWEGLVDGSPHDVMSVIETDDGKVWIGTAEGTISRVEIREGVRRVTATSSLSSGGKARIELVAGRVLAMAKNELWEVSRTDGAIRRLEAPGVPVLSGRVGAIANDSAGNLWIGSSPPVVVLGGAAGRESLTLSSIRAHSVADIHPEADGAVLLATENGLFRHEGSPHGPATPLPRPAFSSITVDTQTAIFGGALGVEPREAELRHSSRRLRVEIAPLSFRRGIRYATRVDGLDTDWNEPSSDPVVELTQLPPGRYTLHVRTTGPSGEVSPEIRWSFVVLRPWYQSFPAIVAWVALAVVAVRAYGRLKSRRVRARARELRAEVAQKTGELQHTVEELSRTRDELEAVNVRLEDLSLHDSLTALHNRRMIDRSMADEWARARRHQTPIAVILIDIDHFKLLNDTRGHREGDACLRAIADHLGGAIVRAGDVVARFGGEEFAVLLPNTSLSGAMHVAEQLRAGIESLALPHSAVEQGHVTASFGVAAVVPGEESLADSLLEAADRALYRAKSEGRNRVVAAEE